MSSKWSGYFKVVQPRPESEIMSDNQDMTGGGLYGNYAWYSRFLQGSSTRLNRYKEYESMDQDVEVAIALDAISEHMSENNDKTDLPFDLDMQVEEGQIVKNSIVMTLRTALRHWSTIHDWETKIFSISRALCIYGDVFFQKTDDHGSWTYIHPSKVMGAEVNKNDVRKILGWKVKTGVEKASSAGIGPYQPPMGNNSEFKTETIPSNRIVRFTLNDDMSDSAPFGESILRPVFRSHRQKMMLEDAILIYRVQRAPERRVYYVDVGKMPPARVAQYLLQMKNEIRQKKIPSMQGGKDTLDSVYNVQSMCLDLNTNIPLLDGRILTLKELITEHNEGKQNWVYSINPSSGEIVPGIISWAGITRKNTNTIKLMFDNGETLICTPDHKIPVQGKGFVEAKDLKITDSLWPFHIKEEKINETTKNTSEFDNFNHNVVKIEDGPIMDTGTLTIDKDHLLHDYHTFATTSCFVRNSEDFFFASRPGGQGTRVETLPGGQNLGSLEDLEYFQDKVWRGMRVPLNWMKKSSDAMFNDDKVGTAYMEEIRFTKFVQRLQGFVGKVLDKEFKLFLKKCNIVIDESLFKIKLPAPTNFGSYRQQQMDVELLNALTNANSIEFFSKRFSLQRFGQITDDDILNNERLKMQELGMDPDNPPPDYLIKIYGMAGMDTSGGLGGVDIGGGTAMGGMIAGTGNETEGDTPTAGGKNIAGTNQQKPTPPPKGSEVVG